MILKIPQGSASVLVAAHVAAGQAVEACESIANNIISPSLAGIKTETLETLSVSFQQRLLKFEPPFVLPIGSLERACGASRPVYWRSVGRSKPAASALRTSSSARAKMPNDAKVSLAINKRGFKNKIRLSY